MSKKRKSKAPACAIDPALCDRLIREAREDDARMAPAPWDCLPLQVRLYPDDQPLGSMSFGVARTRNNLRALADQLEAAKAEVDRLAKHNNEVACALGVEGEPDATVASTAWEARGSIMAGVTVRTERDALRAEVARLRALAVEALLMAKPITRTDVYERMRAEAYRAASKE